MIPIADIDLIARNTRGEENGDASSPFTFEILVPDIIAADLKR